MKKTMLLVIILAISANSFSQSPEQATQPVNNHWLVTSKSQQRTAWILLGSGAAIAATGGIIQLNHENKRADGFGFDFTGAIIAIVGGAVCVASVPFFVASSRSKKKGMSLSFTNEITQQIQKRSFVYGHIPSLTLKVSL